MDRTFTAKQLRRRDDQVERATAKAYATELRQMGAQVPSGTAYDRGVRAGIFAAADHARDLAPERVRAEMLSEYTNKQTADVLWSLVDRLGDLTFFDSDQCPDRETYVKALRHARALLGSSPKTASRMTASDKPSCAVCQQPMRRHRGYLACPTCDLMQLT